MLTIVVKNIPCTFQYIPILETLKLILNQNAETVKHLIANTNKDHSSNFITTGSYIDNNNLFKEKKHCLQLQIYYDDFETTNPLGSKTGNHKLGAFYFTIKNFGHLNSHLNSIHLLALFFTADLNSDYKVCINDILRPIVNDIKILEREGILIDEFEEPVFGTLVSLAHDNLAANILNGIVESFSANYYCRICLTHKRDINNTFSEANISFRSYEESKEHSFLVVIKNNS